MSITTNPISQKRNKMKKQIPESLIEAAYAATGCKFHDDECTCDRFVDGAAWMYEQILNNDPELQTEFNNLNDEQKIDRLRYNLVENLYEIQDLNKRFGEAIDLLKQAHKEFSLGLLAEDFYKLRLAINDFIEWEEENE